MNAAEFGLRGGIHGEWHRSPGLAVQHEASQSSQHDLGMSLEADASRRTEVGVLAGIQYGLKRELTNSEAGERDDYFEARRILPTEEQHVVRGLLGWAITNRLTLSCLGRWERSFAHERSREHSAWQSSGRRMMVCKEFAVVPQISVRWQDRWTSRLFLIHQQSIFPLRPEHSFRTLSASSGRYASFGFEQGAAYRMISLNYSLVRRDMIHNDYWLDVTETNHQIAAAMPVYSNWVIAAAFFRNDRAFWYPDVSFRCLHAFGGCDRYAEEQGWRAAIRYLIDDYKSVTAYYNWSMMRQNSLDKRSARSESVGISFDFTYPSVNGSIDRSMYRQFGMQRQVELGRWMPLRSERIGRS